MNFNTEVVGCYWQEEKGEWEVKLRENIPGQEPREFEDYCNVLIYGAGVLNNFKVCYFYGIFFMPKFFLS
jgi:hypothetical protein